MELFSASNLCDLLALHVLHWTVDVFPLATQSASITTPAIRSQWPEWAERVRWPRRAGGEWERRSPHWDPPGPFLAAAWGGGQGLRREIKKPQMNQTSNGYTFFEAWKGGWGRRLVGVKCNWLVGETPPGGGGYKESPSVRPTGLLFCGGGKVGGVRPPAGWPLKARGGCEQRAPSRPANNNDTHNRNHLDRLIGM